MKNPTPDAVVESMSNFVNFETNPKRPTNRELGKMYFVNFEMNPKRPTNREV